MSATMMIRVTADTHAALHELASREHISMQEVLARAVEAYRRAEFLTGLNADYAALRANEREWQDYQDEVAGLNGTLLDGLESVESYAVEAGHQAGDRGLTPA